MKERWGSGVVLIKKLFKIFTEKNSLIDDIYPNTPVGFTVEIPKEEWAPGIWAGSEGLKLTIVKVDLENRKLTLEWK